ncbi:MAG: hypothetical protein P1P89_15190 [Desulfobacterales bacterium]|nr:hypothetical protein [Desulfobacterales bacterium]
MLRFYTNRELSEKLGINLAKWKRWSRDLLPPDPLGGLQSGYARQYNPADAFTVYLGGHLIADLKYTVPESKQILTDLHEWLVWQGFFFDPIQSVSSPDIRPQIQAYQIFIQQVIEPVNGFCGFHYLIRGVISVEQTEYKGFSVSREFRSETSLPENQTVPPLHMWHHAKLLNISAVHTRFLTALNLE